MIMLAISGRVRPLAGAVGFQSGSASVVAHRRPAPPSHIARGTTVSPGVVAPPCTCQFNSRSPVQGRRPLLCRGATCPSRRRTALDSAGPYLRRDGRVDRFRTQGSHFGSRNRAGFRPLQAVVLVGTAGTGSTRRPRIPQGSPHRCFTEWHQLRRKAFLGNDLRFQGPDFAKIKSYYVRIFYC